MVCDSIEKLLFGAHKTVRLPRLLTILLLPQYMRIYTLHARRPAFFCAFKLSSVGKANFSTSFSRLFRSVSSQHPNSLDVQHTDLVYRWPSGALQD